MTYSLQIALMWASLVAFVLTFWNMMLADRKLRAALQILQQSEDLAANMQETISTEREKERARARKYIEAMGLAELGDLNEAALLLCEVSTELLEDKAGA